MAERTGRIVANDTRESVILDAATFLDTFRDNIWEELGILIHVPLSSCKEDLIPLSKSHAVMTFFGQVIEMNGFCTIDDCYPQTRDWPGCTRAAARGGCLDRFVIAPAERGHRVPAPHQQEGLWDVTSVSWVNLAQCRLRTRSRDVRGSGVSGPAWRASSWRS